MEVPLPNSSMISKDFLVADLSMQEVSSISAINVDIPLSWLSLAPTLVIRASMIGILADSQGT